MRPLLLSALVAIPVATVASTVTGCAGYAARHVEVTDFGLVADLYLAGSACNAYGVDLENLTLIVEYETATRLHVTIQDQNLTVYQIPEAVLPRPYFESPVSPADSLLQFSYTENPFAFTVSRQNGEILFDTSGTALIFESQYLRLRTNLPPAPNLYGLGEDSDAFQLRTDGYTRTLWNRDAFKIPENTNLYGHHPIYIDHRGENGTHGVILRNSNGMDIKIDKTSAGGQYLEYNTLGGIFDFYFLAGPNPSDVAVQISEVVGKPTFQAFWTLGYHNCRYGYRDVFDLAEAVANHSEANIPLETMWTDIDYMDRRKVFSLDEDRFPLQKMREFVQTLHQRQQHYIVMVDPGVAYYNYSAFNEGLKKDVFLKRDNGTLYLGVVWPGVTVFPDWFHPATQSYWNDRFNTYFSKDEGIDIDGLWIDMNEASNFCEYPCDDPHGFARDGGYPPQQPPYHDVPPRPIHGFPPDFQPSISRAKKDRTAPTGSKMGLPGRALLDPPYTIGNVAGPLGSRTLHPDVVHYNGLVEYDTHNMYGAMMCASSREAMLSRRPNERPLVIARSTFLGAGTKSGHWLGDNVSTWAKYRASISGLLNFASIFQIPMTGSDICGFAEATTEHLCARWTTLGAFQPFMRNHNADDSGFAQEAYRLPLIAKAARNAIGIRYLLLDYMYGALFIQHRTGRTAISPMWYLYPHDPHTFGLDLQYFYGPAILVAPVVDEDPATSVEVYLPDDIFYDWNAEFAPVRGHGAKLTVQDVGFDQIPLFVRGGTVLPLRTKSANTTTELRKKPFHIVVAPGLNGSATGTLYLDQGSWIEQPHVSEITFTYTPAEDHNFDSKSGSGTSQGGSFEITGSFNYDLHNAWLLELQQKQQQEQEHFSGDRAEPKDPSHQSPIHLNTISKISILNVDPPNRPRSSTVAAGHIPKPNPKHVVLADPQPDSDGDGDVESDLDLEADAASAFSFQVRSGLSRTETGFKNVVYDFATRVLSVEVQIPLTGPFAFDLVF